MPPFARLLLVVGPSGSGKSTLIDDLAAGTLPPTISGRFPAGAGAWPVVPVSTYRQWEQSQPGESRAGGLIVHVDKTMCFIQPGIYEDVLPPLRAASATVVEIGTDPAVIAARLMERVWQARNLSIADASFTREAFLDGFHSCGNGLPPDDAPIIALAARAGIPELAAYKLALTRRPNWIGPILALWHEQTARHWSGWTVDHVALMSGGHASAADGRVWRLAGFSRRTY